MGNIVGIKIEFYGGLKMNEVMICKAIVGVAMSTTIAVAVYKTKNILCLWALFFVASLMVN